MYKAVIFDLDGTLLDTLRDLANAANHMLSQLGLPAYPIDAYRYKVGNGIPKLLERCLPEERRDAETLRRAWDLFMPYYDSHKQDCTAPYPGIPALLQLFRQNGVRLGVVSNKEDKLTHAVIDHYFPAVFDGVAGHVPGTPPKPDPARVNALRAQFGLAEDDVLYVGDSNVDIETAHNARLAGCGVLWGFRSREELCAAGADFLAASPDELAAIVLGRGAAQP